MSEPLIKVDGLSKKYCRSLRKSLWYGFQDMGTELFGRKAHDRDLRDGEFWALNNFSFELKRGESLGLVGRNGAGKTTLLRMLCGLIKPDAGRIEMRGRVSALIALGAGFNPVLTGRENIYVSAAVYGLTRNEIDGKLDEIIEFSELEDFIDMAVQSYSSGMIVRLGFSIAAALKPDILILDEVLAVGDLKFQIKCGNRIRSISEECAVIVVSHNMYQLRRLCERGIYLENGTSFLDGNIEKVTSAYELKQQSEMVHYGQPESMCSWFMFSSVNVDNSNKEAVSNAISVDMGELFSVSISYRLTSKAVDGLQVGIQVKNISGETVFGMTTAYSNDHPPVEIGMHIAKATFNPNHLLPGTYSISVSVFDESYKKQLGFWDSAAYIEIKPSPSFNNLHAIGNVSLPYLWEFSALSGE
jgi:ABC-type polysaccharide/polyol phosphate transport system ATPase subunit